MVRIAIMVPMGMDLWASRRSPDLFEPAIIPERKKERKEERKKEKRKKKQTNCSCWVSEV